MSNRPKETRKAVLAQNPKQFSSVVDMIRSISTNKKRAEQTIRHIEERNVISFLIGQRVVDDLSQSEMAAKMGCTQSKISKLESGRDNDISLGDLNAYVQSLGFELMINLGKKDRTLVQQINAHTTAIRNQLTRLSESIRDTNASPDKSAVDALLSTAQRLTQGVSEVIKALAACLPSVPKEERNVIQIQADTSDN